MSSSSPARIWLITGPPAIGKSTLISKVVFRLRSQGIAVGGCLTKEVRRGKERTGFRLVDLLEGTEVELASTSGLGPRVGKYRVNIRNLSTTGSASLLNALQRADVIVIDEVGPMELTSPDFRKAVKACLGSSKRMLVVLHESMRDPLIEEISAAPGSRLTELTLHNRDSVAETLASEIVEGLEIS